MLNILWVEDEYSEQKKIEWFKNRNIEVLTNFDAAEKAINANIIQFDMVVLDINLENTEHSDNVKKHAQHFGITAQEFLEESGMNLFFALLEKGFPKEQIIFLTANADRDISLVDELRKGFEEDDHNYFDTIFSEIQRGLGEEQISECKIFIDNEDIEQLLKYLESYYERLNQSVTKNTYNRFCEAYKRCRVLPPRAINKGLNEAKQHLDNWLENHEENYYLVLRRGIIAGCDFLKSRIKNDDSNVQFRDFIKIKNNEPTIEIPRMEIENYLAVLSQCLPIKQSYDESSVNIEYRLFLRTLVHEWEENIEAPSLKKKYANDLSKIHDIYTFGWIMKTARNWTSHANLIEPLDHQIIAFLFLVNMRAMFKLPKAIQPYEKILLGCISVSPSNAIDSQELNKHIIDAEQNVDGILAGLKINESGHFGEKINAIYRQNTGNPDAEKHDFKCFLLQYFWVNQKSYLRNLIATSDDFLPTLARHIYHASFQKA
jgi:hypothetical protein